jgi:hypothetical protein
MTASVRIRTASVERVLRIPNAALHFMPPGESPHEEPGGWTIQKGALRWTPVVLGVTNGELTAVAGSPVAPGTELLTDLNAAGRKAYGR